VPARRAGTGAATLVLLLAARAAADPVPAPVAPPPPIAFAHLASGSAVHTDGGSDLRLPPGYFVDAPGWAKLDAETKRLQDAEVRLTAENHSLRAATSGWQPGWRTLALTLATGLAGGWYLHSRL
jgi:hypothetical protein